MTCLCLGVPFLHPPDVLKGLLSFTIPGARFRQSRWNDIQLSRDTPSCVGLRQRICWSWAHAGVPSPRRAKREHGSSPTKHCSCIAARTTVMPFWRPQTISLKVSHRQLACCHHPAYSENFVTQISKGVDLKSTQVHYLYISSAIAHSPSPSLNFDRHQPLSPSIFQT